MGTLSRSSMISMTLRSRDQTKNLQPVLADIRLHSIDIRDKNAVLRAFAVERPDSVAHLAARAGVNLPSSGRDLPGNQYQRDIPPS